MSFGGGNRMGGLLGGDFNDPAAQRNMAIAAGLLAGGAPSVGVPTSLGGSLGKSLMMGMDAGNKAQQRLDRLQRANTQVVGGSLLDMSDPANPKVVYEQPEKVQSGLLGGGKYTYTKDRDGNIKVKRSDVFDEIVAAEQKAKSTKPLPTGVQKAEDEDFGAIDTASNILTETQGFMELIDKDKLSFSPLAGVTDDLSLMFGGGDEDTLNRQSFDLFLQRLRNASLRLNKGTQTEGDAERALQEIVNNRNNTKAVRKALQDLQRANERAVEERKRNINRRRKAQGAEAFSFDDYTTPTTSSDVGFKVID
jgi:hypothetical protein